MDEEDAASVESESRERRGLIVVGVGASAARADSAERFLANLQLADDLAIVLAVQHREALDETRLREALARVEDLRIVAVEDGGAIRGGKVYLCAPDKITTVQGDRFAVRPAEQAPGGRGTVDSFLVSLATEWAEEAVGIVLAGTGGDGTLGVAALKDGGGLAIAEASERDEHLAESTTPAALADTILPVDEMFDRIFAYAQHLRRLAAKEDFDKVLAAASSSLVQIADILRNRTGNDFHGYKQNTFLRRVQRRMQVVQVDEVADYAEFLRRDKGEVQQLFNDLLIGVTQFFRDPAEFDVLKTQVIPRIFDGKTAGSQVRVWVLGCATGEEAYSIGILLREHMASLDIVPQVQIFATDLDGRALAAARVGRYRTNIELDVTPERLARWFVREGDTYTVVKELREMCIFSQHNLIKDAPFSRLDLVSCRNLLIYLNAELQNRVIPLFHFALLPDRYLFLGTSENVTRHPKHFAPIDRKARIFKRLETGTRLPPEFPISMSVGGTTSDGIALRRRDPDIGLERRAQRIAERYAPAYMVTDEQGQVLHFSGRTGRYLEPTSGAASLEVLNLVHRDLRLELRNLLGNAQRTNEPARAETVPIGQVGDRLFVDLTVEPIQDGADATRNFVVLFKDAAAPPSPESRANGADLVRGEYVERIEGELRTTRDRLQATIEELESTNEELKSSNEEYQSLNEELQSANEELETSREELQSVNEELTTVNGELAHRVQDLTRATSDLKNLLEATQIATVFLDNEQRVMNFTPAVTQVLHLVETDIGRPIAHIKARVPLEDVFDDVRTVLRTLNSVEREIEAPDTGTHFIARILPYRSIDNFIAGAVLTFTDVTAVSHAERALRESEERFRAFVTASSDAVYRMSPDWQQMRQLNGRGFLSDTQEASSIWMDHYILPEDQPIVQTAIDRAIRTKSMFELEHRVRRADGSTGWTLSRALPILDERGGIYEWLGTASDVTVRKLAEEELQANEARLQVMVAELQHRTRNLIGVVKSIAAQTMRATGVTEAFWPAYTDRLEALSRVQGLLSRADIEPITLRALLRMELDALGAAAMTGRVGLEGPEVRLRNSVVQTLALALHELATNARKYGALAHDSGTLAVTWREYREGEERRLAVEWSEASELASGANWTAANGGGYGRELIERALPYTLGARTTYEVNAAGLVCTIDLPLDKRTTGESR